MTTKIEWAERVWNPVSGCTHVSAGCDHCYAVAMTRRLAGMGLEKYRGLVNDGKGHFNGTVKCHEGLLEVPLSWKKPATCFVNSMSDLFHEGVPTPFIDKVMAVIALAREVNGSTFLVLTKRPDRAAEYFRGNGYWPAAGGPTRDRIDVAGCKVGRPGLLDMNGEMLTPPAYHWPIPNLWIGVSAEDQATYDRRVPILLQIPAAVRFVSLEPLLGPVDVLKPQGECGYYCDEFVGHVDHCRLDWVIVGGESGPKARTCDVDWIRSIKDQCQAAGIPCFVKQLGSRIRWGSNGGDAGSAMASRSAGGIVHSKGGDPAEWPEDLRVREWPREEGNRQ